MLYSYTLRIPLQDGFQSNVNAVYKGPYLSPRYKTKPGQQLPAILNTNPGEIQLAEWGIKKFDRLEPVSDISIEELETNTYFVGSFRKRRCLILADGYYDILSSKKFNRESMGHIVQLKNKGVFAFAGIWMWHPKSRQVTFAIIDRGKNFKIHPAENDTPRLNYTPIILPPDHIKSWLETTTSTMQLKSILNEYQPGLLETYPISDLAFGGSKNSSDNIKPIV